MSIFSRRNIQRALDSLVEVLTQAQLNEFANRLSLRDPEARIAAEWEVILISALAEVCGVEYEPEFPGQRKADLRLTAGGFTAIADITTLSDRGAHDLNPVEQLTSELCRIVGSKGLDPNKFGVQIDGNYRQLYKGGPTKPKLKLPTADLFRRAIFNQQFYSWIRAIKSSGLSTTELSVNNEHAELRITYNPKQMFFNSGHLLYTVSTSVENNPLFNRIDKKADQLRDTGFEGSMGVIVCDGGCDLLTRGAGHTAVSRQEVIRHCFSKFRRLDFIEVITIKANHLGFSGPSHLQVVSELFTRNQIRNELLDRLSGFVTRIVRAENLPSNAGSNFYRFKGKSFIMGWSSESNKMRLSSRALQELLAGRIDSKQFLELHNNFSGISPTNLFERKLQEGRLISQINLISVDARDDDWIEISFGDPDPAISAFSIPKSRK
jgi:hypothetical protein